MATAELTRRMTAEEFLAIPDDDGVHRELIRGELRETEMTTRFPGHTSCEAAVSYELIRWNRSLPRPRGAVHSGEVRVRLARNSESVVGMDVAYLSAELAARTQLRAKSIEGAPLLAVIIVSPSDKQSGVVETVELYLEAGVQVVWVADPFFQTVAVHRSERQPELYNADQTLSGDPELPGFSVPVLRLFEDAD